MSETPQTAEKDGTCTCTDPAVACPSCLARRDWNGWPKNWQGRMRGEATDPTLIGPDGFTRLAERLSPPAEGEAVAERQDEREPVRVGFRYQDGEVLSPECEAASRDDEMPETVLDLGDGEWLTLAEVRTLPAAKTSDAKEAR